MIEKLIVAELIPIEHALDEVIKHLGRLLALADGHQRPAESPSADLLAMGQRLETVGPQLASTGEHLVRIGARLIQWANEPDPAQPTTLDRPPEE